MDDQSGKSNLLLGLLFGAVAGVAVGMLMAPKSGSDVRSELRDRVQQGRERIQHGVERIRHRGEEDD